jgi:hypothetical protein
MKDLDLTTLVLFKFKLSKDEKVIVIGQSMGGVVGHILSSEWNVSLLITIGSPLRGSKLLEKIDNNIHDRIKEAFHKPMYYDLIKMIKEPLGEPECKYHCITMSWPFSDFDGCIYVDEGHFDKDNHTHLKWADHRTIFVNPRLWYHVHKIIEEYLPTIDY